MVLCNFFMQGRCRYGDKCWNEHPSGGGGRGGDGGGRGGYNSRPPPQQQHQSPRGGGGGFGNRVWVNPSQRSGGNYVQPSSFPRGGEDWDRGGGSNWGRGGGGGGGDGGRRDNIKSSEFSFSNQNRFSALNTAGTFNKGPRDVAAGDDNEKHLETIQKDMEIWETSGQWAFSCYSVLQATISGFSDLSPEELRQEYYNNRASGDLQGYANGLNQLISQWRSRVTALRIMSATTRIAMLSELNNPKPQVTSEGFVTTGTGFGSSTASFGTGGFGAPAQAQSSGASGFSFATPGTGFGSTAAQSAPTGFGGVVATATQPPPSGFGSASAPSASSFSFAAPAPATAKAPAPSASAFSFSSTAGSGGGFGGGFGAAAPATGGSVFGQASGASSFGGSAAGAVTAAGSTGGAADSLFTPQGDLSADELKEFGAKRFTLGQIPLRPPPADMLVV